MGACTTLPTLSYHATAAAKNIIIIKGAEDTIGNFWTAFPISLQLYHMYLVLSMLFTVCFISRAFFYTVRLRFVSCFMEETFYLNVVVLRAVTN